MNKYILPPPIHKGDLIGLISPSSPIKYGSIDDMSAYFNSLGYHVKAGSHVYQNKKYLAGRDEERVEDIMTFFSDPEIKAIVSAGGGYGSQRLLPYLDYDLISQNKKLLIGFSDTTSLSLALLKKCRMISYSGLDGYDISQAEVDPLMTNTLNSALTQQSYQVNGGVTIHRGYTEGPLIGGTIHLATSLIGTPYLPELENAILLFEQPWLIPKYLDLILSRLYLCGIFDQVSGIIFGQFKPPSFPIDSHQEGTIEEVIDDWSHKFSVPTIRDFPYSHFKRRCILPIGHTVQLDADNCTVSISFRNQPLKLYSLPFL